MSLGVHSKASNMATYSELGRYPLFIDQISQCMKYIDYIENDTQNKLLKNTYTNLKENNLNGCSLIQMKSQLSEAHLAEYWKQLISTNITLSGRDGAIN